MTVMTNNTLAEALEQCRAQFQFYADEHTKADKTEKAATNQRFADMCAATLRASTDAAAEPIGWISDTSIEHLESGYMAGGMVSAEKTSLYRNALYTHPPVADAAVAGEGLASRIADMVCVDVAELPDRTSPEDQPDMMLVESDELHEIVCRAVEYANAQAALSHPAPAEPVSAMGLKDAFATWKEKRGVWPRVFSEEAFEAGWISARQQPAEPVVLREALKRAASDMTITPRHNRGGVADKHIRESRERIRLALSTLTRTDEARADGQYLVWSNEHQAWWGKDRCGYTRYIDRAGRYERSEALSIAGTRDGGWHVQKGNPDEIAIPERDAIDQYASITAEQSASAKDQPQ